MDGIFAGGGAGEDGEGERGSTVGRREKPLEPTAGPVQRLAYELRKLRVDAGTPTYRSMAQRVPYSAPTLSAAASGERLPSLAVLLAYVAACDGDAEEWERRWQETVTAHAQPTPEGTESEESPYPGLARFGPGDRSRFHGRDDLVDELLDLTARHRLVVVLGASGSGKSSLLRAGLIPALREPGVRGRGPHEEGRADADGCAGSGGGADAKGRAGASGCVGPEGRADADGRAGLVGRVDAKGRVEPEGQADASGRAEREGRADMNGRAGPKVRADASGCAELEGGADAKGRADASGCAGLRGRGGRPAAIRILTPGGRPARTHRALFTPADGDGDTLLVVDQFEETFALCRDPAERARFLELLLAAREPARRLRVILAVRADFYGHCAEHAPLADALREASLLVGPMTPARLREAVVRPATAEHLVVERALTARIVADVADEPGGLPLMAHALREVWRRRSGKTLTEAAYEAIGGVRGAVAHTAEEVFESFTEGEAAAARRLLLRMVEPGDGTQDTRRPVERAELPGGSGEAGEAEEAGEADRAREVGGSSEVLERLVRARLLIADGTTVALAHEALLSAWPRLRGWVEADRERLRLRRGLTEAAYVWRELGRDAGALYRGARLTAARDAFAAGDDGDGDSDSDSDSDGDGGLELSRLEREFLRASVAAHDHGVRASARAARRSRVLVSALAVLLCLAAVAGAVAWQQNRTGKRQRAEAEARRIVGVAQTLRTSDPVTAARLSVAAWRLADLPETREAVRTAGARRERDAFAGLDDGTVPNATRFLSANGRVLTSVDRDRVTRWDMRTHRRIGTYAPHHEDGAPARVSADGRLLAVWGERGVQVVDLRRKRAVGPRFGPSHRGSVEGKFGPSGRTFVVVDEDRDEVQVWDVRRHRLLAKAEDARSSSSPAPAVSPDDRLLATCLDDDGGLTVTDIRTGRALRRTWPRALDARACTAQDVSFTPDGRALVVPADGSIRTWDVRSGRERPRIRVPGTEEPEVAFSADGAFAVTLGRDEFALWRTARPDAPLLRHAREDAGAGEVRLDAADGVVRHLAGPEVVRTVDVSAELSAAAHGLPKPLQAARFSPDGRTVATVEPHGGKGDFKVRRTRDGRATAVLPGRTCADCSEPMAFSPDGRTVAYAQYREDGTTLRAWDLRRRAATLRQTVPSRVDGLVIPGAGAPLVTTGGPVGSHDNDDRRIDTWRVDAHTRHRVLRRATAGIQATLTPDGRSALTWDGVLTDLATGRTAHVLRGEDIVETAEFSPDGRYLAVVDHNGKTTLWNGRGTRVLGVLSPGSQADSTGAAGVPVLSFSADGRYLAAGRENGSVRLWETSTPRLAGADYPATDGPVLALGFADGALRVATPSSVTRSLAVAPERAAAAACAHAHGGLTRSQWRTHLPNTPYRATC
ncbi:hypothetical protein ACQB60_08520 [Actinomycetota bacterium Odt1-20B]